MDNVLSWFNETKDDFANKRVMKDVHVDHFYSTWATNQSDSFTKSINAFKQIIELAKQETLLSFNYQVDLRIELISDYSKIKCVPGSISELIESIDMISVPEILFYIPETKNFLPALEYYCSPLPFNLSELPVTVKNIYEEYRTMEEFENNAEYSRWLTFTYLNSTQVGVSK